MKRVRFRVIQLAAIAAAACTSLAPPPSPTSGPSLPRVVGYLASWGVGSKGTRIADLPARDLTHIFYAFGDVRSDGQAGIANQGTNFDELARLKALNPHLKVAISIGGWTGSGRFSDVALTDSSRRLFARSAIDLFIRQQPGVFDGIDIDWEFPVAGGLAGNIERPADRANFTLLLAELRGLLDAEGVQDHRHYELTIAASARPLEIANLEIARIAPLLDFINVMTYDYHSGPGTTNFNAPLYAAKGDPTPGLNVDASIRAFVDAGVAPGKLLVGVPFYGHGYGDVPSVNDGLFQQGNGTPIGWKETGGDWRVLAQTRLRDPHYVRHWESSAQVPWLYDSTTRTWVSYDDPQSVAAKARYVREHHLGGVVIWELGGDDGALMRAIAGR
ncbi:MAG TPA: glycoside hydrolase family 18 protein [Gemmatimonadaceae bacterium]|nr:glycoside hydrolase family 18 protein [Gemmatimonadaceae bacterium]